MATGQGFFCRKGQILRARTRSGQGRHLQPGEVDFLAHQNQVGIFDAVVCRHLVRQAIRLGLRDGLTLLSVMRLDQPDQGVSSLDFHFGVRHDARPDLGKARGLCR